ncbi:MAG: hypothetical protein IID52_08915 [Proteobacteria bacterium]|nr:hypothetical protein [Pseudomonadota bacterium]
MIEKHEVNTYNGSASRGVAHGFFKNKNSPTSQVCGGGFRGFNFPGRGLSGPSVRTLGFSFISDGFCPGIFCFLDFFQGERIRK